MSVQPPDSNPDHAVPAHDYPATPPYGDGFAPTLPGQVPPPPPGRSRRSLALIGLIVAAVLALGGTALKLFVLDAKPAGAADPAAAAESFINNLAKLHFADVASLISPAEKAALETPGGGSQAAPTSSIAAKAVADISQAITIDTSTLKATAGQKITEGVERVDLTSGSITVDSDVEALRSAVKSIISESVGSLGSFVSAAAPSALPLDEIDQTFDQLKDNLPATVTMTDLAEQLGFTPFIVTVKEDGAWYASISLTIAEYAVAAAESNGQTYARGSGLSADEIQSFSSPSEAVTGLKTALQTLMADGDTRALAKVLPPAEGRLLAIYGPVIESVIDHSGASDQISINLDDLAATPVIDKGNWVRLGLDKLSLSAADDTGDGSAQFTLSRDDKDTWALNMSVADPSIDSNTEINGQLKADSTKQWKVSFDTNDGYSTNSGDVSLALGGGAFDFALSQATDGETETDMEISVNADCLAFTDNLNSADSQKICAADQPLLTGVLTQVTQLLELVPGLPRPEWLFGVTAIKTDGGWNISAMQSFLGMFVMDF